MTATVEFDHFTAFTYENLLIHASPPPVKMQMLVGEFWCILDSGVTGDWSQTEHDLLGHFYD